MVLSAPMPIYQKEPGPTCLAGRNVTFPPSSPPLVLSRHEYLMSSCYLWMSMSDLSGTSSQP